MFPQFLNLRNYRPSRSILVRRYEPPAGASEYWPPRQYTSELQRSTALSSFLHRNAKRANVWLWSERVGHKPQRARLVRRVVGAVPDTLIYVINRMTRSSFDHFYWSLTQSRVESRRCRHRGKRSAKRRASRRGKKKISARPIPPPPPPPPPLPVVRAVRVPRAPTPPMMSTVAVQSSRITDTYGLYKKVDTFLEEGRLEMTDRDRVYTHPHRTTGLVASGNYREGYRYSVSGPGLDRTFIQPVEGVAPFDAIGAAVLPPESVSPIHSLAVKESTRVWDLIAPVRASVVPEQQRPERSAVQTDLHRLVQTVPQPGRQVYPSREEDEEEEDNLRRQFTYRR